ncbi:putative aldo-keto reductase [Biscogniauxia mediterranea]|nr:putative aldo-keto reductase [Biscogniauxia mediterranea]
MSTTNVPHYPLGKNGPSVPALGFGLMDLSHKTYGSVPGEEVLLSILDRALELGCTHWDTSDLYGDNESLVGKWFKRTGKRDQIFLATKFGYVKGSKTGETDSSAAYCKKACEESLKALGIESIDLYYLHNANPETPIEETMRAMAELQAEGKIKYIGLSTVSSATLRRAVKIAPVAAVQIEYSPFTRDIETDAGTNLLATCRELGVAVVVSSPLGRGLLTSTFSRGEDLADSTDIRPKAMPRFQGANREQNVKIISQFKALADKKGCTLPQLSLAWLLKQGHDIFPIPGTKSIKHLEDNWGALGVSLTDEEEAEIRSFAAGSELAGDFIPPAWKHYAFRDTKEEE